MSWWTHLLAIGGLVGGAIVWWLLQRASGGEKAPSCTPGEGCSGCGAHAPECKHPDEAQRFRPGH